MSELRRMPRDYMVWDPIFKIMLEYNPTTPQKCPRRHYIGVCDVNGKKVYEGDILTSTRTGYEEPGPYLVEYVEGTYILRALGNSCPNWEIPIRSVSIPHEFTVIGNYYENPELML